MAGTSFGPRSLLSLGYNHVGIDDGWQQCASNSHGFQPPYGYGYHDNTSGLPIPNTAKFPNMNAMTAVRLFDRNCRRFSTICR